MVDVWLKGVPSMKKTILQKRIYSLRWCIPITDEEADIVQGINDKIDIVQPELILA